MGVAGSRTTDEGAGPSQSADQRDVFLVPTDLIPRHSVKVSFPVESILKIVAFYYRLLNWPCYNHIDCEPINNRLCSPNHCLSV